MRIINTKRAIDSKFNNYEKVIKTIPALMGDTGGTVQVPGRDGYVYVRDTFGNTLEVWNSNAPLVANLAVKVGVLNGRVQVIGIRDVYYNYLMPSSPPHGSLHSYASGGTDIVNIYPEQFMPWYAFTSSGDDFTISVIRQTLRIDSAWVTDGVENIDLNSYIPVTATNALYLLISLAQDGSLVVTEGSEVANKAALTTEDIPALPNNHIPLWAIILYVGQTSITRSIANSDYIDLRFSTVSKTERSVLDSVLTFESEVLIHNSNILWLGE